jgi:hypothetical protein
MRIECLTVREALEDRIEIVQRVADLVDRERLGLAQLAAFVEGFLFEEAADGAAGPEEIVVVLGRLVAGREDRAGLARIEGLDEFLGACPQSCDFAVGFEIRHDREAVAREAFSQRAAEISKRFSTSSRP